MEVNTKYNLGDKVFIIGNGKILQAKVCEVRVIERYEETTNKYICEPRKYIVYRLTKDKLVESQFRNNTVIIDYRGEYERYDWFDESQVYKTKDEALDFLNNNVEYLTKDEQVILESNISEIL